VASGGGELAFLAPQLLIAGAFSFAALLLASASARDRRALFLLATFVCAAAAFARALSVALGGPGPDVLFRGIYPEALAPAALWQFAIQFPAVRRFARFDVWARRSAAVAWALGIGLFVTNLALAYPVPVGPLAILGRDNPANRFWHLFAAAALPAIAAIGIRAHRAPRPERDKVARFGWAIAAGAAPFLVSGVARLASPKFERWMHVGRGPAHHTIDVVVVGALAAMPVLSALALVADRPFDVQTFVPAGIQRWLARRGISPADVVRMRPRQRYRRDRLTTALDRIRRARGPREIADIIGHELRFGVGARHARVVAVEDVPPDSALLAVLEASTAPLTLTEDGALFPILPAADRGWLREHDISLAAPLRVHDGSVAAVAVLGPRRDGGPYDATDRWFLTTLLTGAGAAWHRPAAAGAGDAAFECVRCGAVADEASLACGCNAGAVLAALPRRLGGEFDKFTVAGRLGAGGMGIVYLARDEALGRDVALKTLPALRDGAVARLRDEARAMANLNHPALATIYGLEVWRGTPVLVVEFFARGTLADRLASGPLSRAEVVSLGIRLAGALSYMHARGVLHRDVKPSNIGISESGAKLLDFGLSADLESRAGTPAYLPPEVRGGVPASRAADLWGLASVLLEAAGGRAVLRDDEALAAFFERAFARDPAARFQTSAEFAAALPQIDPSP